MEHPSKEEDKADARRMRKDSEGPGGTGKVPPPYGSKAYWDQRYNKLLADPKPATAPNGENDENSDDADNDEPVAFHSWYFSYDDLKPIILPLILGGKEEVHRLLGDAEEDIPVDDGDDAAGESSSQTKGVSKSNNPGNSETKSPDNDDEASAENDNDDTNEEGNNDSDVDEDEDGWEEASGEDNVAHEDEEEEISQTEAGLTVEGPVAVLEVGCGDVPLVLGLAQDLERLSVPGSESKRFVDRIVCTDYSATLIDTLKRIHQKKRKLSGDGGDNGNESAGGVTEKKEFPMEYLVADARELPFPDKSFHLILEKGTMDAMISDAEVGVSNCIGIVSDCARALAIGGKKLRICPLCFVSTLSNSKPTSNVGCFFLVSHINAHTSKGEEWLNEVVLAGLRKGGGDASWNIEVHGNAQGEDDGDGDDDDDDASEHPEAAGPAVYLIFKGPPPSKTGVSSDPPAIPLKFFCY